jgi:hypothetical protein
MMKDDEPRTTNVKMIKELPHRDRADTVIVSAAETLDYDYEQE